MKLRQRHIVILCSRLDLPGGIERAIVNTASLLHAGGMEVTILVLDETAACFYPLDRGVKQFQAALSFGLDGKGSMTAKKIKLLSDIRRLKKIILALRPTEVIATEYPFAVAAVLSGVRRFTKLITWEHHHYGELKRSRFWETLFLITYPKLHAIVCLNADEKKHYLRHNKQVAVIPNFVVPAKEVNPLPRQKRLLTVARLTPVKGIDRLLEVAARVLSQNPDWQWKIIGNGEQHEMVCRFIKQHNLSKQLIVQAPASPFLTEEYQEASLYVMTSRNECFPMTLLEAAQQGLPLLAFDCETGPRNIIEQGQNGFLVTEGDIREMAARLHSLMTNDEKRTAMAEAAKSVKERFSAERALGQWQELFIRLA